MSATPMHRRRPAAAGPDFDDTVLVPPPARVPPRRPLPAPQPPTPGLGRVFLAGLLWGVLLTILAH